MNRSHPHRSPAPRDQESRSDMTPMIDCVFLLIIFFLCIDFRSLESKLPAYLPKNKGSQSQSVAPQEQLRLRILCVAQGEKQLRPGSSRAHHWVGHEVRYALGAEALSDLDSLRRRLAAIHADPSLRVGDARVPGGRRPMDVVIEPGPGVVYGDVAPCVDTVAAAGFASIHFGGGR